MNPILGPIYREAQREDIILSRPPESKLIGITDVSPSRMYPFTF